MIVLKATDKRELIELVRFSSDNFTIVAAPFDSELRLWRKLASPESREILTGLHHVFRVEFTPDCRQLVMVNSALHITVLDLDKNKSEEIELWANEGGEDAGFLISPDGKYVIATQTHHHQHLSWMTCRPLNNPSPKAAIWTFEFPRSIFLSPVLLGSDCFLVTETWEDEQGAFRHAAVIRSLLTGKVLSEAVAPELSYEARAGAYPASPDGSLLACFKNSRMLIWSTRDFSRPLLTLGSGRRKQFTGIAFHPSGRFLAATSNDTTVKLYDTETWQLAKTFTWDIGRMRSIAFSPDGLLAAAGSDTGKIIVWDVDV